MKRLLGRSKARTYREMMHSCILILIALEINDVLAVTVHLSPEFPHVIENDSVHVVENDSVGLNCSLNGSLTTYLQWTNDAFPTTGFTVLQNNSECKGLGFLTLSYMYELSCQNDWAFIKINKVYRNQSDQQWQCSIPGNTVQESNQVRLYVIVPVASVQMTFNAEWVEENAVTIFACETSTSRPAPFVFWFLVSPDQKTSINISNASVQTPPAYHTEILTEVKSVLSHSFTRTYGGGNIYCLATNMPGKSVASAKQKLTIFYPPEGPPTIKGFENGSTYRIVEAVNAQLSCTVTGGNPSPNITWSCLNVNIPRENVNQETIISNITWEALRYQNDFVCLCKANHILGLASVFVVIKVLYPPDRPKIMKDLENVTSVIQVIQNNSLNLTCEGNGNPEPEYKWINKTTGPVLKITSFQKQDTGKYICKVNNEMIGSDGEIQFGQNSSNITAQMLYPPTVPTFLYNDTKTYALISGNTISVIRGDQFRIFCQSNGSPSPAYRWENNTTGSYSFVEAIIHVNKTCNATNLMNETVGESRLGTASARLFIDVLYPPIIRGIYLNQSTGQHVSVKNTLKVLEGESFTLSCDYHGRPTPHYIWYQNDSRSTQKNTIQKVNISRHESGIYTCRASNTMIRTFGKKESGSSNISTEIDILFPPTTPTYTYIDHDNTSKSISSHSIDVIKGDLFTLVCHSSGNPNPDYRWENGTSGNSIVINASISINKTCTVTNTMKETIGESHQGNKSTVLSLTVNYSPVTLQIYLHHRTDIYNATEANILKVLEGSTVNLSCESDGRPTPKYTWYLNNSVVSPLKHGLEKVNISRHESGTYTCHAYNTLIRTFGNNESGSSKISTDIDVLYPADIGFLDDLTVIEGSSINISCPVISGNPPPTNVKWLPGGDLRDRDSHMLYIANVTREDEGIYNCSVNSTMKPSYDRAIWKENSRHFKLNIVYKATVRHFFVENQEDQNTVVNETDNVTFRCHIDGQPMPNVNLSHNGNLINVSESTNLTFTKRNVQCYEFGTYMCSGNNDYNNGTISSKTHTLLVNCSPRPSPDANLTENMTSARFTQATLSFTTVAYPKPGPSGFIWYFLNKSEEITPLTNRSNLLILSSTLWSSLTVLNVTGLDYGEYLLQIKNEIGVFEQRYSIVPPDAEQKSELNKTNTKNMAGLIVGIICGLAIVIVASVLGVRVYRKRHGFGDEKQLYENVTFQGKHLYNMRKRQQLNLVINETSIGNIEVDDLPEITNEQPDYCNTADLTDDTNKIKIAELHLYVIGKDEESFNTDFQKFPTGMTMPCTFARRPENIAMNRYNGIYPYDHSRVKVHDDPDFFINACYIDGYKRANAYIASLGPTAVTTCDYKTFWQMVWHEKSDIIVMLTNLREISGMKCERYWPETKKTEFYGGVCVISQNVEEFAEYTIRTFILQKDKERRSLTHLHYTAWPDKKVPEDATSLLEFRQRIKATTTSSDGPTIVHCSAGIGRTGTLIAIDRLIEEGLNEGSVNVFECISRMREQRTKMVQTLEQYIYIHKALVNALSFHCETISVENIRKTLDTISNNEYSRQYQQLRQSVETDTKEDSDTRADNERLIKYNRRGADVPADRFRVLLYLSRESGESDYINAVYMNSFRKKDYFIIAQSPLPKHVADFVSMIYQEECTCIVTMEDLKEPGMIVGEYLPKENQTINLGNFTVGSTCLETKHHYTIRKMRIQYSGKFDSGEKTVYHFQYTKWMTGHDTPVNIQEFVQFVNDIEEYANGFGEERPRVLVHCLKANERSGLFCAVTTLIEKMRHESGVNVLNTLRHLRTRRRTTITSMEQLKFCYQAMGVYSDISRV